MRVALTCMIAWASLLSGCLAAGAESEDRGTLEGDLVSAPPDAENASLAATRDDNLAMGNPSNATATVGAPDNYLLVKPQYALSYNNSLGSANWVSWHLSSAWKGSAPRQSSFTVDSLLPPGFVKVASSWYKSTGFDRGHLCPSEDRDGSIDDNKATFTMTNVLPQAPVCNQVTWQSLEAYAQKLITTGNEIYIIAGPGGMGGSGSLGAASSIHGGGVRVPSFVWKVLVVLPVGSDDTQRVAQSARVIAVKMPNTQSVNQHPWGFYRLSVDSLEALTGFDFLSSVDPSAQDAVEATVDAGPTK